MIYLFVLLICISLMVSDIAIKVSDDISKGAADFATVITVTDQGQIKG